MDRFSMRSDDKASLTRSLPNLGPGQPCDADLELPDIGYEAANPTLQAALWNEMKKASPDGWTGG